jgi:hypothetical protein
VETQRDRYCRPASALASARSPVSTARIRESLTWTAARPLHRLGNFSAPEHGDLGIFHRGCNATLTTRCVGKTASLFACTGLCVPLCGLLVVIAFGRLYLFAHLGVRNFCPASQRANRMVKESSERLFVMRKIGS